MSASHVVALTTLAAGFGLYLAWSAGDPDRITAATAARLRPGMTEAEVAAVVGQTDDWVAVVRTYGWQMAQSCCSKTCCCMTRIW